MNRLKEYATRARQVIRWAFWSTAAAAAELASRHRKGVYRILFYGPFAVTALAAFILGRTLGAILMG